MRNHQRSHLRAQRLENALQFLLILAGLALLLAIPGFLLAGLSGVLAALALVLLTLYLSARLPARLTLSLSGAGLLRRHHAPELYRLLERLYRDAGLKCPPLLFYVPSQGLNAFAVGDARDGGIAITEGLARTLTLRELAGVLAHEVSHLRHGDTRVMSVAAAMTRLTVWGALLVQLGLWTMMPLVVSGELEMPWATLLLVSLAPWLSTLLQLALSRNREYTADLEAAALTGDPLGLASALKKLEALNGGWLTTLFDRQPPRWIRWLNTHPPTLERIRRLLALAEREPGVRRPVPAAPPTLVVARPTPLGYRYWLWRR